MSKHTDCGRVARRPLPSIDPSRLIPLPRIPIFDAPGSGYPFEDIPELPIEIVPPSTLKHLAKLDAKTLEAVAEIVIAILDAQAGDPEREEDNMDCCEIGEDIGSADRYRTAPPCGRGWSIGDDEDAEDDGDGGGCDIPGGDASNREWQAIGKHTPAGVKILQVRR
jgi:hypothetical protein